MAFIQVFMSYLCVNKLYLHQLLLAKSVIWSKRRIIQQSQTAGKHEMGNLLPIKPLLGSTGSYCLDVIMQLKKIATPLVLRFIDLRHLSTLV